MASENLPENCLKHEENASKDYIELEIPHKLYETLASGNCDMLNMCRVCLSTNNDVLYSLLSAKDSVLCSMFATFTNMQVAVDDGLPSHLCEMCQMQVVQCYEFKLKCERAHCLLKSVLNGEFLAKEELPVPVTEDTNLPVKDEIKNEIEFHEDCEYLEDVKEKDSDDDTLYIVQSTKKTKKHKMKYLSDSDLRINKAIKEKNLLGKRGKKYVCNLCSKVFLKEKTFRSHIESQHLDENKPTGPLPFPCSQCKYAFDSEHDLAIHSAVHSKLSKSNVFKCNKCSKDFKSKGAFRRHLLRHMKSKRYACDVCAKSFTELYALRRHLRVHTGERVEKKHQCHLCDKRYSESSQLTVHLSRHVGLRPWRCPECHKTFPSERLLDSHRLVHSDQKAYPCSYCDRRFRHESTRNTHHRTHTGEKPYVCSVCGKSFIQNSNLTLHMRTHTGERPYSCAVCSRRFKSSSSLKTHERVHTGERPYACPVCGKRFARRNMAAHLRAHSGERPFACSVCPKRFVNNSRLRDHFRVHTGEKPFECASCTLTFATKSHLVKHLKVHQQPPTKKTKKQIEPPLLLDKPDQVYILTPFELPQSPANTVIVENGIMTHSDNKEIPSNMDIPLELSGELVLQDTGSLKGGVIVVDNELQSEYQNSIKDDMCLNNADVNIINNVIASSSHDGTTVKLYQLDQSLVQIHSAGGQVTISKITSKMTANF